ncbi:hypothetical protein, partial [Bacteroides zoogleoformans]|uniref:hypothetical protein n=1 Tax=Bacteroides zoogleoformans TaxID=28119 RepID=UPI00248DAFA9
PYNLRINSVSSPYNLRITPTPIDAEQARRRYSLDTVLPLDIEEQNRVLFLYGRGEKMVYFLIETS